MQDPIVPHENRQSILSEGLERHSGRGGGKDGAGKWERYIRVERQGWKGRSKENVLSLCGELNSRDPGLLQKKTRGTRLQRYVLIDW